MRLIDLLGFAWSAVRAHRQRSILTMLGIAVGIATVVLLTALGEGLRQFVYSEFTQFGTNLIGVQPGKASTLGGSVGQISTNRPLSLMDARLLARIPSIEGAGRGNAVGARADVRAHEHFRKNRIGDLWRVRGARRRETDRYDANT